MKKQELNIITAKYNRTGYAIMTNGVEVYRAGNNPLESSWDGIIELGRLPLETICRYCSQTASDIAEECNGRVDIIEHWLGAKKL